MCYASSSIVNYAGCTTIYTNTVHHLVAYCTSVTIHFHSFVTILLFSTFLHCLFSSHLKHSSFSRYLVYFMAQFHVHCSHYIFMCVRIVSEREKESIGVRNYFLYTQLQSQIIPVFCLFYVFNRTIAS